MSSRIRRMEIGELRLDGLDELVAFVEPVALEWVEQVHDALGAGSAAEPFLRIEGMTLDAGGGHALAEFAFESSRDAHDASAREREPPGALSTDGVRTNFAGTSDGRSTAACPPST